MYQTLYNEAVNHKIDIVVSNVLLERDSKFISKKSKLLRKEKYNSEEIKKNIIRYILAVEDITLMIVSNKIYKKELILNNNIFFDETLKIDEDTLFNLKAYLHCESIKIIDFDGYLYKNNTESVTRDFLKNNIFEQN